MKTNNYYLFISVLSLIFGSLVFTSCNDDDDGGSSSKIAGKWKVERIYDEGTWENVEDMNMDIYFALNNDFTYTSYTFEYDEYHTLVLESDENEIMPGTYSVNGKLLRMIPEDGDDELQFSYSLNGNKLTLTLHEEGEEDFKLNLKHCSDDEFNLALEKLKICGAWAFYGEENNDYVFFFPDGVFYSVTTEKDWVIGKTPFPDRKYGEWQFSDGKLFIILGKKSTSFEYELDEYWVELTLKSKDTGKTYERESTSIVNDFLWEGS